MTGTTHRTVVGAALLLLLVWRIVFLVQAGDHPFFDHPVVDAQVYDELARRIAGGEGYPLPVFASNPFYPYFLAAIYKIFGPSTLPVAIVQVLLGLGSAFLVFVIGRRIGGAGAGLLALLLCGLYRPLMLFEGFLLPTSLGVFINLALIALLVRRRPGGPAAGLLGAGLLLGIGTLLQGNLLLFLPFLAVWLFITEKGKAPLRKTAILLAGFLVVLLPVTLRNAVRGGDFVLVSSHGGVNFYMGNNEEATGVFSFPDEEIVMTPENINIHDSKRIAEKAVGKSLKPSEVSRYWTKRGLDWIGRSPGSYLALLGRKTALFWNNMEIPDNVDLYFYQESVPALRWAPFLFGVIAPLGLFGVGVLLARREGGVVLLFLGAQFLSALLFYSHSRYRIPFAVLFTVPAAVGFRFLFDGLRRWGTVRRLWSLGLVALLFVLFNYSPFASGRAAARAYSLSHLANGLLEMGEPDEAELLFREALELLPEHATSHYGLGRLYQIRGEEKKAAEQYRNAVRIVPSFAEAYLNLGASYHALGEDRKAAAELREAIRLRPEWAGARYNLGNVLFDMGRFDEAAVEFGRAVEMDPGNELFVRIHSNARERAGDREGAEETVRLGLTRIGESADLQNRLGDLLEKDGRTGEALGEYLRAVEIDPRHSVAWNNIGLLYYHQGDSEKAIETWRKILVYDPASPVVQNIRMAEEAIRRERVEEVR